MDHAHITRAYPPTSLAYALVPALLCATLLYIVFTSPLPWSATLAWVPVLDIHVGIRIDSWAAQYLLLITGVGTAVFIYAASYLGNDPRRGRLFILLLLFMGAMIGAVISDHLVILFLFWELTSLLSFLLVGWHHEHESSRKAALQALLVTGTGGLALLAGIIMLALIADSYSLQEIIARAPAYLDDPRLYPALLLIMLGAFTKSAQVPFHFWLPNAMAAPTPVSAYLHSATMVKLGIYLLARLDAAFSDLLFWELVLTGVGTVTAVGAAVQTWRERDLKRILAWSTVAALGTLTTLVGLPGNGAAVAVAAFFFAHALYKAPLFFVVGNLDHGVGTRLIDQLSGLRRMPWTALAALLAALSMAGLPLSFGFVAKDALVMAKAEAETLKLISYATVFVTGVSVAVAAVAAVRVFWGRDTLPRTVQPHEAGWPMLMPALLLAGLGILFGLMPTLIDPLLGAAARNLAPNFNPAAVEDAYEASSVLGATLTALALGLVIYFSWDRLHRVSNRAHSLDALGPESWYRRQLQGLPRLAAWQTRVLQHGLLPRYVLTLVSVVTSSLLALTLPEAAAWRWPAVQPWSWPVAGAGLLILLAAVATLRVREHLVLLLVSSLVGYGSAVLFLFTGAPDLALTQFAVETVFVVVAAAVLLKWRGPSTQAHAAPVATHLHPLKLLVAVGFGSALTLLVLLTAALPLDGTLAEFFATQSVPAAQGRNVVNVILVDFRALDTLGEIAVVACSLFAALPLLKLARTSRGTPS